MAISTRRPKIVIIGMGPCGLGAAWRLQELGHDDYKIFDQASRPGGLACSHVDEKGFTWDNGGHVQFSHYKYFDDLMDSLLPDQWLYHERSSWVWIRERFVPYPLQNNIRYLPKGEMWKCLSGLIDLHQNPYAKPENFKEWILAVFGNGLAETFMLPYNYKVWGYDPSTLSFHWIGERVAIADLKRISENIILEKDDLSWGPNNKFRFPLSGGTGEIWRRLFERLDPDKAFFNSGMTHINTKEKFVEFQNGHRENYDALISTIPLDKLVLATDLEDKSAAEKLVHSSINIVGVGLKGRPPDHLRTKSWMYFPESSTPFYRVTVFSNYSPNHVPKDGEYWSLMSEVSESPDKKVDHATIREDALQGMLNAKLIPSREDVVDVWYHYEPYGYPTPTLQRDEALTVLKDLDARDVFSRGRFGAWKYEVSNQDHALMQGVEVVNKLLLDQEEVTVWNPQKANSGKN